MAEPKTRKPKAAKPAPKGQGSMNFDGPAPQYPPTPSRTVKYVPPGQSAVPIAVRTQSGATSRPTGTQPYTRTVRGITGTPKYSSVTPEFNATSSRARVVSGDRTVTNPGAPLVPSRHDPKNKIPTPSPGRGSEPSPPTMFNKQRSGTMPDPTKINIPKPGDAFDIGDRRYRVGGARLLTGDVSPKPPMSKALTIDSFADASKGVKGVKGLSRQNKGRLLGLGILTAGLGTGYLLTRNRNENENAAKGTQKTTDMIVPGRNAPPSLGNASDRALYPAAGGSSASSGSSSNQPSLGDRVRANNKANRSPTEYLGEAFDATVKRGRDVGRKHLQGMIVRDSVDESTAKKLMDRYDKEIGAQSTLKDYKSEGIAQKFDKENPGKAGRILSEYRAMGRSADAAPSGATYKDIKARALR